MMGNLNNTDTGADAEAPQRRATAGELTQALAQIEARREAEARRAAGAGTPGQGAGELELEITPEELLAEVRALRQKTEPARIVQAPVLPTANVEPSISADVEAPPVTHCPACSRKLLTQASALCNWCGARIDDPSYQERAARSRQDLDRTELTQLETLVQEEARYGIFGRLKRRAKQNPGSKQTLG